MTSILKVDEIQNTDGKTGIVITPDGSLESVKFPETTGGDPNRVITSTTMSSYEEGTWVPVITTGTGTVDVKDVDSTLNYTKVGRLVTLTGRFRIVQVTGASGFIRMNLPFNCVAGVEESGFAALTLLTHGVTLPADTISTFAEVNPFSTDATFYRQRSNSPWTFLDASGLTDDNIIYVNGTYAAA